MRATDPVKAPNIADQGARFTTPPIVRAMMCARGWSPGDPRTLDQDFMRRRTGQQVRAADVFRIAGRFSAIPQALHQRGFNCISSAFQLWFCIDGRRVGIEG
ncbi:MAG: hypothetical protein IPG64_19345 [Haliea sp.]|nr:hypothetical protein [Haliea sp.]